MSVRIKNIKAGSLYGFNLGVRSHYDYTDAMLVDSLFLEFLVRNGLDVRGESTRDVICLNFDYGSRSYEEEMRHLKALRKTSDNVERIDELILETEGNRYKYDKKSKDEIRRIFYNNGVSINYGNETIHYRMLYRNPSKAKTGQVIFICERLYDITYDWMTMGFGRKLPFNGAKIVELSAYAPLIASSIVGKIHVPVDDVLIVRDQSSFFRTMAKVVRAKEDVEGNKYCVVDDEETDVKNELWDGMALIDSSVCPQFVNGMALLRNHFFKACAFKTNIQLFFKDWCAKTGWIYDNYEVLDMWGNPHKLKDIKIITTNNAVKFLKFQDLMGDNPYNYWKQRLQADGEIWGIVKTDHPSKLGSVQQMSYQMVNTLPCAEEDIAELAKTSIDYVLKIKNYPDEFEKFLRKNANAVNHYELMADLYHQNNEFANSIWFLHEKNNIINGYVNKLKNGKITVNGDNLTACGNPYALLLYVVGDDWQHDPTLQPRSGTIECYTKRFRDGQYLCGFRSPHNSANNISYLYNRYSEEFDKYFEFSENVIALNCIKTDIQSRMNGMDFDSDFLFVSDNEILVRCAEKAYAEYPTIVNELQEGGITYSNSMDDFCDMDAKLAKSQLSIGESSNLAQLAITYYATEPSKELYDIFVILSVIAQLCIDSAKRVYEVDGATEIKRIKKLACMKYEKDFPEFMRYTKKVAVTKNGNPRKKDDINADKGRITKRIGREFTCPMNSLVRVLSKIPRASRSAKIPNDAFFVRFNGGASSKRVGKMFNLVRECDDFVKYSYKCIEDSNERFKLICDKYDEILEKLHDKKICSRNTINKIIELALGIDDGGNFSNRNFTKYTTMLLKFAYKCNKEAFLESFLTKYN